MGRSVSEDDASKAEDVKTVLGVLDPTRIGLVSRAVLVEVFSGIGIGRPDAESLLVTACPTPVTDLPYKEVVDYIFADCSGLGSPTRLEPIVDSEADATCNALAACKLCLPGWSSVEADAISCEVLAQGASGASTVLLARAAGARPPRVAVRMSAPPSATGRWTLAEAGTEALSRRAGLVGRTYLASDPRAPGITVAEFLGQPVHDGPGPGWLGEPASAEDFGKLVGTLHSVPDGWFSPYESHLWTDVSDASASQVLRTWAGLMALAGPSRREFDEAVAAAGRYGHAALELYGGALTLRRSLEPGPGAGGAGWDERLARAGRPPLSGEEKAQLCRAAELIAQTALEACGLLAEDSVMGRLVVGHCDLHALNVLRRESDGSLAVTNLDAMKRAPAVMDLSHMLSLFVFEPDSAYPALPVRRALASAYLGAAGPGTADRTRQGLDDMLLDMEKGIVINALFIALASYLTLGARQRFSWAFLGAARRALAALRAAEHDPGVRERLLREGVKPAVLGTIGPHPFARGARWAPAFWADAGAARRWFPDLEPPLEAAW